MEKSEKGDTATRWTNLELGGASIQVLNPSFPVPQGLEVFPDFITEQEASAILNELDERKWQWGGFAQKRRIQRYAVSEGDLPPSLIPVMERLVSTVHRQLRHVVLEEYPCNVAQTQLSTNRIATSFESPSLCDDSQQDDSCGCCFVAQVALLTPAVQHLNCPQERDPECWNLVSPNHWTGLYMEPRTLVVKSGDVLRDWRSRVAPLVESKSTDRVVVMKFYSLPEEETQLDECTAELVQDCDEAASPVTPMPPLEQILTIIVTTSPIRSNPSTELLERTFDSFRHAGDDFCYKCRKIIVCDGCRVLDENGSVSRKHTNAKQALRNGIATTTQAQRYQEFKGNLKLLCENAPSDSPFYNATVEELQERHGYGFALRHALLHCVSTKYVAVIQHDRTFMRRTPIHETVRAMWSNANVKYVGMSMRSNLRYRDIFQSKFGRAAADSMATLILRPPELALDSAIYGPDGRSYRELLDGVSVNVRKNTTALAEAYKRSSQCLEQEEWLKLHPMKEGLHQLTLTPTLFWYDNTHICDTAHYRDFIFHPKYQMVARGGFVEDKLSPNIKAVERLGLPEGHARYGCYLLDDHSGYFFTGHLDGGNFLTDEQRQKFNDK